MKVIERISDFLNSLKIDISLYIAILEFVITKIKKSTFLIRATNKRGILNLSITNQRFVSYKPKVCNNSYCYNTINKLGNLFIKRKISLKDFLFDIKSNMSITDATYLKRKGKKIYGVFKNPLDF